MSLIDVYVFLWVAFCQLVLLHVIFSFSSPARSQATAKLSFLLCTRGARGNDAGAVADGVLCAAQCTVWFRVICHVPVDQPFLYLAISSVSSLRGLMVSVLMLGCCGQKKAWTSLEEGARVVERLAASLLLLLLPGFTGAGGRGSVGVDLLLAGQPQDSAVEGVAASLCPAVGHSEPARVFLQQPAGCCVV